MSALNPWLHFSEHVLMHAHAYKKRTNVDQGLLSLVDRSNGRDKATNKIIYRKSELCIFFHFIRLYIFFC